MVMEAGVLQHFISTSPAEWLIASIWQGLVLTTLTWLALKLASGLRASARFALWLTVFLLVALLPCIAFTKGIFSAEIPTLAVVTAKGISVHLSSAWAYAIE